MENCAKESGFKRRKSKITPSIFIDMLLYCASLNTGKYSLSQTGAYSFETFGVYASKQSIDERFNVSAQSFVKSILSHLIANYISISLEKSYLSHFERVRIKDSTKFILPDFLKEYYRGTGGNVKTSKAGISIQFEYDIKSASIVELVLTDGTRNDITDAKESLDCIGAGDLIIRDLGYCSLAVLEGIKQREAFFIYRLMPSLSVFDFHGEEINFKRIYEKMRKYSIPYLEMIVYIGNKERIMTRLCISLASEKAYNQRLNKLKKANQRRKDNISENSKLRFKLNLFITNVPAYILSAKDIQDLYHIRWQIELIFKQWKSTCGIHQIPTMKVYRFLCVFYAKLILILTCSALANLLNAYYYHKNKKLLSIHKCMKTLWNNFGILRIVIKKEEKEAYKNFRKLIDKVSANHCLERKNKKLSYIDLFIRFTES